MRPGAWVGARAGAFLCLISAALFGAAWADVPQGPRVVVSPEPGKPPDMFAAEQDFCRSEAESTLDTDASEGGVLRSAVVGTVLGAAAGALLSGRHHDNAAVGAVAGLVMGVATGSSRQAAADENAQRGYDNAYEQCMFAKGNGSPRVIYHPVAPPRSVLPIEIPPVEPPPVGMPWSFPPPPPPPQ